MAANVLAPVPCGVTNLSLAPGGKRRIEFAATAMPVLQQIRRAARTDLPLEGFSIAACLPIHAETANLIIALREAGAEISVCAPSPLSIQDEIAASLVMDFEVPVFAQRGETPEYQERHRDEALKMMRGPVMVVDDGGGLIHHCQVNGAPIVAGTEETLSALVPIRELASEERLRFPVVAITDSMTRHLFENRYGTGQSTVDAVLRATNYLLSGLNVVVAGYGWAGRGVAMRTRGLGANVTITEVDSIKALEALMDGFRVMPMLEAASLGDVFIMVTGNRHVVRAEHLERMKSGALLANAGNFHPEIDLESLTLITTGRRTLMDGVQELTLDDGRRLLMLGDQREAAYIFGEGPPTSIADIGIASQALSIFYLAQNASSLERRVYPVPPEVDREVARLKLVAMGVSIDSLTAEQRHYWVSWSRDA